MHRPVCITYDSTCDLTPQLLERFRIRTIPLTIQSGERVFPDDGSYTSAELYDGYRRDGTLPKTSAISPEEFRGFFSAILDEGFDVVHIDISSDLSCTCQNAVMAAQELADKYAAAGMRVEVDRSNNTIGYKIRAAQQEKIPYMLVVGGKEVASGTVSVRSRKGEVTNDVPAEEFMLNALREIASKAR